MMMKLTPRDEARFWAKVEKSEECWLWTSQLREGYGLFRLGDKILSAHRVSYAMAHGELPDVQICHSCDTPSCVNPDHLFLGTAKVNSDDKMLKDRHNFSLSNEQVLDIRTRPLTKTICRDLAQEFNTTPNKIKKVLDGTIYQWLPGARELPPQFTAYKFTPEQLEDILHELSQAKWGTQTKLAKKYNVTRGTISHINNQRLKYTRSDTE